MRKAFRERLGHEWLFCDGAAGTQLQAKGLKGGELPETWNISRKEDILDLYRGYLRAGANIFNTNTFGANALKFPDTIEEIVTSAVELAIQARRECEREDDAYIALDMGPTGRLLKPLGDLPFERAVELFGQVVRIGAKAGADLVLIETMTDSYEAKAAVLAAKENCDLPVCITMTYDEKGKLLTGGTVDSAVALLEGLHVDALGVNCSLGPEQLLPIVKRITEVASLPIIVNPNAGLPRTENGQTVYDIGPEEFSDWMVKIAKLGVQVCGGCCGTTPEHIRQEIQKISALPFRENTKKHRTVVTSFSQAVEIGNRPLIVGERINPTGKKKFKKALVDNDIEFILNEGLREESQGADILDVNVGLPEIDEPAMMETVVTRLQGVLALPLQIDTSDIAALERGMRYYNGKPMVNSTNGKREVMEQVMPLVAKYGGVLVGLALDEDGIPDTADGRIRVAKKIYDTAAAYGISRDDIVIDGLAMTVSSDPKSAKVTLETIRRVRDELHGHSILGVSNISFGLPLRPVITSYFLTMAMQNGLSCAIINPGSEDIMRAYRSYCALMDLDPQCMHYIETYANAVPASALTGITKDMVRGGKLGVVSPDAKAVPGQTGTAASGTAAAGAESGLRAAIEHGMTEAASRSMKEAIDAGQNPLDVINAELIPALNKVGEGFEKGTMFLPQLLMAADAAKAAFEVVKESMADSPQEKKGKIILATVKGDIHDIGKNIVKVMLENYSYDVIDLGKDVPPEVIADTAIKENVKLVGLSALMTTTVVSMEETIKLLHKEKPDTKIVVGGAVLTQDYADQIGADCYAKDAMATVHYAQKILG